MKVSGYFELISFVLHAILKWKINKYKMAETATRIEIRKNHVLTDIKLGTFFSSKQNSIYIFCLILGALYVNWVNTQDLTYLSKYPHYFHMYVVNLIGPNVLLISFLVMAYLKSPNLRNFFIQEIRDMT